MSKDRKAVTSNGRSAFYAAMWEDIRKCAMNDGWAVAIHGSLSSDMDIMAMPWTEDAASFKKVVAHITGLFTDNALAAYYEISYSQKPNNRVVATIPIWSDFYLDISTIMFSPYPSIDNQSILINGGEYMPLVHGHWISVGGIWERFDKCSVCGYETQSAYLYCQHCGAKMDEEAL